MQKALGIIFLLALGSWSMSGCSQGPGVGTEQEAKESMDASMKVDTMGETKDSSAATPTTP